MPETASYSNNTGDAQTVYFIIDGYYMDSFGLFEFTINTRTP